MAVLDGIYNAISGQIDGLVSGKYSAVAGMVSGPLQVGMAINLMVVGYAIMRGITNEPWGAYIGTWIKAQLVILAATSSFGPWVASDAMELGDRLAGAIGGGPIGNQFDSFVENITAAAYGLADGAPKWEFAIGPWPVEIPNLSAWALYFLVMIAAYFAASIALATALWVKLSLGVTVVVGPIFVGMLLFPSASGMFFSWLGQVLNLSIQTAGLALMFVFVTGTVEGLATGLGAGATATEVYGALILQLALVLISALLFAQVRAIASFAGGGGASAMPIVGTAVVAARAVATKGVSMVRSSGSSSSGGSKSGGTRPSASTSSARRLSGASGRPSASAGSARGTK